MKALTPQSGLFLASIRTILNNQQYKLFQGYSRGTYLNHSTTTMLINQTKSTISGVICAAYSLHLTSWIYIQCIMLRIILLNIKKKHRAKLKRLLKKYKGRAVVYDTKPAQTQQQKAKATTTKRNKPRKPAVRPADVGKCEYCGQPFIKKRSDARFCGSKCRVYYGRHKKI